MAKEIDIGLPDGGEITVPAWSTEDTQRQIYTVLKSMQGVDKETVKKLEEAQRSDDKNSQKQIDALKQLGKDLKEGMDGGVLGTLTKGATMAGSALGTLGKYTLGTGAALVTLGAGLGKLASEATDFALSYSDSLKPLMQSGMAFGTLGTQIEASIVDLTELGFSANESAQLINNTTSAFTKLGAQGLGKFTNDIQIAAEAGRRFGLNQQAATEYLLTELEERARTGVIDRMNSSSFAAMQFQVLEDQIKASRRLGMTVDQIAESTKEFNKDNRMQFIRQGASAEQLVRFDDMKQLLDTLPLDNSEIADLIATGFIRGDIMASETASELNAAMAVFPNAFMPIRDSLNAMIEANKANDEEAFQAASNRCLWHKKIWDYKFRQNLRGLMKTPKACLARLWLH